MALSLNASAPIGLGEQYPVVGNETSVGRQQNRRVEVIISDETGKIPDRQ